MLAVEGHCLGRYFRVSVQQDSYHIRRGQVLRRARRLRKQPQRLRATSRCDAGYHRLDT